MSEQASSCAQFRGNGMARAPLSVRKTCPYWRKPSRAVGAWATDKGTSHNAALIYFDRTLIQGLCRAQARHRRATNTTNCATQRLKCVFLICDAHNTNQFAFTSLNKLFIMPNVGEGGGRICWASGSNANGFISTAPNASRSHHS